MLTYENMKMGIKFKIPKDRIKIESCVMLSCWNDLVPEERLEGFEDMNGGWLIKETMEEVLDWLFKYLADIGRMGFKYEIITGGTYSRQRLKEEISHRRKQAKEEMEKCGFTAFLKDYKYGLKFS